MFFDSVITKTKPRKTADGYLVATALAARTGIQEYLGAEVGRPDLERVRVYRPEAEVFSTDAMGTYAHKPVTLGHPADNVTAASWKDSAVGHLGGTVARDGEHVALQLVLMDSAAIDAYEGGQLPELSAGYSADLDWTAGKTPDGQAYDCVQRNIRINHLALVHKGRAGSAKINDGPKTPIIAGADMQKIKFGDLTIEVNEAAAEAIGSLQKSIEKAKADLKAAEAKTEAKDAEIATKDAEIAKLKDAQLKPEQLQAAVAARSDLLASAAKIADADYGKLTDPEIKALAVATALGAEVIKDKSQAYIDARFDILLEAAGKQAQIPTHDARPAATGTADIYAEYEANLNKRGA